MPTTEQSVKTLRINRLTNEQYETAVKSDTELYLTPDTTDADIASAIATHNSDTTSHSNKQDKLTTQTAYSAKGSATKVPQITTNSLGQVTAITEVTITQPTVNNATLTIQKNGTTVNTFTANASSNVTANITVPTTAADVNAVPTTRTVNSKALSSDITLTAADVGAVSTANGVTAVVAGTTANIISVTKNGSTSNITVNNVENADKAKLLIEVDTRSTNSTPQQYMQDGKGISTEFKTLSSIGITGNGTYGQLQTYRTWGDSSGGYPTQICVCSSNNKIFRRVGTSNTVWGAWKEIAFTDAIPTKTSDLTNDSGYLTASTIENIIWRQW